MNKMTAVCVMVALAACAPSHNQAAVDPIDQANREAIWRAENCRNAETYQDCQKRVLRTEIAARPAPDPQAVLANSRYHADRAECEYQSQTATMNLANDGTLFYGAINQAFQQNRLFNLCMEAADARRAAYAP